MKFAAFSLFAVILYLPASPAKACGLSQPDCGGCATPVCSPDEGWVCTHLIAAGNACANNTGACRYTGTCDGAGTCVQNAWTERLVVGSLGSPHTGSPTNIPVTAQRCNGGTWQTNTAYRGTVTASTNDAQIGSPSYACQADDAGQHRFVMTPMTLGTLTLNVSDSLSTSAVNGSQSAAVTPGPVDHITIEDVQSPAILGQDEEICFHRNGPAIEIHGFSVSATLRDRAGNPTTSSDIFRLVTNDPGDSAPDLSTSTSTLRWGNCANPPYSNGVTYAAKGSHAVRVVNLNDNAVSTSNPATVAVVAEDATVVVHVVTDGVADALPAGGVDIQVIGDFASPVNVTASPTWISLQSQTSYSLHSRIPTGYAVSFLANGGAGSGKEVSFTSPAAGGSIDVTFSYTTASFLASWLGDYDPPSAAPSGPGIGQWGQIHCGEAARVAGACPVTRAGETRVVLEKAPTAVPCSVDADCAAVADNTVCNPSTLLCSHTSGSTGFISLTDNVQPTSGRFQLLGPPLSRTGSSTALRVEVQPGDFWSDAETRNELTRQSDVTMYTEGQEGWFSWSSKIDALTFESDINQRINVFNTITQWHHSGECGSEPLGFSINRQSDVLKPGGVSTVYALGLSTTQLYMDPGCNTPGGGASCEAVAPACTTVADCRGGESCVLNDDGSGSHCSFKSTSRDIWVAPETEPALPNGQGLKGKWLDFLLHIKFSATTGFVELWYRTDDSAPYVQQGLSCADGEPFTAPRCHIVTLYNFPSEAERNSLFYLVGQDDFCFEDSPGHLAYGQSQVNDIQQGWYRKAALQTTSAIIHDSMRQTAHFADALPTAAACQCLKPWADGSTSCQSDDQPCPL